MELIDSHAHIDFPQFAEDREAVLDRARAAGVTALLAIGTGPGPEKVDAALPFAEQHDWIYATVGIHPHEAKEVTQQHLDELARLAKHPKVIAWGEIGLDYFTITLPAKCSIVSWRPDGVGAASEVAHRHSLPRCVVRLSEHD